MGNIVIIIIIAALVAILACAIPQASEQGSPSITRYAVAEFVRHRVPTTATRVLETHVAAIHCSKHHVTTPQ